ncbi:hypothetical protein P7K49_027506 [Saguinus oedipus]|uniref:Nucleoplasmin core domain-containing protein n=1 Tax=Saguinus oedipus TaxID=9490 RepID=A0ABQ9U9M7_SAGOE|nr:hypothetical protein P7K49_027506 [Saguinus oedipus]
MNLSSTSSTEEKAVTTVLWGEWRPRLPPRATPHLRLRAQSGEADLDLQTPAEGEAGLQAVASYGRCARKREQDGVGDFLVPTGDCEFLPSALRMMRGLCFQPAQICLGEKAKEEMHRVEILPPGNREDKKTQPVTIASLQASVLPMVRLSLLAGKQPPAPASPSPSPFGGNGHTRGYIHPIEFPLMQEWDHRVRILLGQSPPRQAGMGLRMQ